MPVYEYKCQDCKFVFERIYRISDFPSIVSCDKCGRLARKILSKVQNVRPNWEPYFDENLDTMITGREHRRRLMKEQGLEDKYIDPSVIRIRNQKNEHNKREGLKNGR